MFASRPDEEPMIYFNVTDMTCGRSAGAVTQALMAADARAKIQIDLPMRRVSIVPTVAAASDFRDAIQSAGYTALRQWPSSLLCD